MRVSSIILAREGSKGIPKKNNKLNKQNQAEKILKKLPASKIQIFLNKCNE